jgi:cytochrome c553
MKLKSIGRVGAVVAAVLMAGPVAAAGDAEAGAQKVAVCATCHGAEGISLSPQFPNLAGQVPGYIAAQLAAFKAGDRQNAMMAPMAANLSEQDMADIDAFYALKSPRPGSVTEEQADAAKRGEKLYRGGYTPFQVPACMGCHGPAGSGIPPTYPRVNAQHADYLEAQLLAFKSGERSHEMMSPIAFKLNPAQMRELALYMSAMN